MLNSLFTSVFKSSGDLTPAGFLISIAAALLLGFLIARCYLLCGAACSRGFAATLALLPAIVGVVIMMASGSLGAGVAVAGTFSLVRFRSAPGTAREIGAVFLAMAVGLACGMGYAGFAALFTLLMCGAALLYAKAGFGARHGAALRRTLHITVPEDLQYHGMFDDLFEKFATEASLVAVKTTNLGSLNKLTYDLALREAGSEQALIDALRCRNGNLEVSLCVQQQDGRDL